MAELAPFKDRREVLFGREATLQALRERFDIPGITGLVGRPQSGKSWLLEELARSLREEKILLVGYQESKGGVADNILHAVKDLYTGWLSDSSYYEQAKMIYTQQSGSIGGAGVGVLAAVFAEAPSVSKPIGVLIGSALDGLLKSSKDLNSGRLILPPLQYDQARELLAQVYTISEKPLILILDAWEQTAASTLADEHSLLHAFVRDRGDWPHCHCFVALRPESPALQHIENLQREFGEAAKLVHLDPLDLSVADESQRLIRHLHKQIAITKSLKNCELLTLIDGYAGVIGRWLNRHTVLEDVPSLYQLAEDAQKNRYPEIETFLSGLNDESRALAIRLSLLDNAGIDNWPQLSNILLGNCPPTELDHLLNNGLLENANPPSYGHAKRAEVMRKLSSQKYNYAFHLALDEMVACFAERVTDVVRESWSFAQAIVTIGDLTLDMEPNLLGSNTRHLIMAARTLFGNPIPGNALIGASNLKYGSVLLAMGLANTLIDAKAENDLKRRDALLDELRALATAYDEAAIRERLAKGLFNTLNHSQAENDLKRRDALLDELRALATACPQEALVQEALKFALSLSD